MPRSRVPGPGPLRSLLRRAARTQAPPARHELEALEGRTLLSFDWTPQEVYLAELVNRARANPQAEGARLGINLAAGLSSAEQARLVAQEPLALNQYLTIAARAHSADMAARNFFDHLNPDGQNPTQRAVAAGYSGSAGENIAAGYSTIDAVHKAWLESVEHRKNVLSLWGNFDDAFHYDDFGPGVAMGVGGTYNNYFTEEFGVRSGAGNPYLLGVVIVDADNDQFYDIGEGRPGVRVDIAQLASPTVVVATTTTGAAGNYQIALPAGAYRLNFTDTSTGRVWSTSATVSNRNLKVDARIADFTLPVTQDDHANAGQWLSASTIAIVSSGLAGTAVGALNSLGDSDLFKFVPKGSGEATISLGVTGNNWNQRIRVFDAGGRQVGQGVGAGAGTYAVVNLDVTPGATYFVLVDNPTASALGNFVLVYEGPGPQNPGTPDPDQITSIHRPKTGSTPMLGMDSMGRTTATYLSENGKPIFAVQQPDNSWDVVNLAPFFNTAVYSGPVLHWTDRVTGRQTVAVRADKGVIVFFRRDDDTWAALNATIRTAGAINIGFELTLLTDLQGYVTLAGRTKAHDIVAFTQKRQSLPSGSPMFTFTNITAAAALPNFTGALTAWTTSRNTLNIAAVDASGALHLFWKSGNQPWLTDNLNLQSGFAGALVGSITGFQTAGRGTSIVGTLASGELVSISWRFGHNWRFRSVSGPTGPGVQISSLSSYVSVVGPAFVTAVDADGHTAVYRFRTNTDAWNLVSTAVAEEQVKRPVTSIYYRRDTNTASFLSFNVGGQLVLATQGGDGVWTEFDLSPKLAA